MVQVRTLSAIASIFIVESWLLLLLSVDGFTGLHLHVPTLQSSSCLHRMTRKHLDSVYAKNKWENDITELRPAQTMISMMTKTLVDDDEVKGPMITDAKNIQSTSKNETKQKAKHPEMKSKRRKLKNSHRMDDNEDEISDRTGEKNSKKKIIKAKKKTSKKGEFEPSLSRSPMLLKSPSSGGTTLSSNKLPLWLSRLEDLVDDKNIYKYIHEQLQALESRLLEDDNGMSKEDVYDIVQTMKRKSNNDMTKLIGMTEFVNLLLSLEEGSYNNKQHQHMFITRDVILASVIHFSDCVSVRQEGVYEFVQDTIYNKRNSNNFDSRVLSLPSGNDSQQNSPMSSSSSAIEFVAQSNKGYDEEEEQQRDPADEETDEVVTRIAKGAARIKQIEILAHAVYHQGNKGLLSLEETSKIRDLLINVMDDWRSLAIRSAAALYRLDGILSSLMLNGTTYDSEVSSVVGVGTIEYTPRAPEIIQTARDALRIYAPLAQRLGMQRLKSKIEESAFRLLYRRQYNAVLKLYSTQPSSPTTTTSSPKTPWDARIAMQSITTYLTSHITHIIQNDPALSHELESYTVKSRVKEPYSLWKKILKSSRKKRQRNSLLLQQHQSSSVSPSLPTPQQLQQSRGDELSITEILDVVALRVTIKAKKWSTEETDETTRERERILCYCVQKLIENHWPCIDEYRFKDYIQNPKKNGYQSLHYTSSIGLYGLIWPFEVQVRSEEMHRVAEFGIAAHWDYKLPQLNPSFSDPPAATASSTKPSTENEGDAIEVKVDSYVDALVTAKQDLAQQKVFVFLAHPEQSKSSVGGKVLSLPFGAKVRDVILQIEEQFDENLHDEDASCDVDLQLYRNGVKCTDLDEFVYNGDVLLVEC